MIITGHWLDGAKSFPRAWIAHRDFIRTVAAARRFIWARAIPKALSSDRRLKRRTRR
jgi:hypothetical protein